MPMRWNLFGEAKKSIIKYRQKMQKAVSILREKETAFIALKPDADLSAGEIFCLTVFADD